MSSSAKNLKIHQGTNQYIKTKILFLKRLLYCSVIFLMDRVGIYTRAVQQGLFVYSWHFLKPLRLPHNIIRIDKLFSECWNQTIRIRNISYFHLKYFECINFPSWMWCWNFTILRNGYCLKFYVMFFLSFTSLLHFTSSYLSESYKWIQYDYKKCIMIL